MKYDAATQKALEAELNRLEALDDIQLLDVLAALDNDPAPQHIKTLIMRKVNNIMNKRIGLPEHKLFA